MEYALVSYPLSSAFRDRFEQSVGAAPVYVALNELRALSLPKMLRKLKSLDARRLFLPLEDESSRSVLPILQGLAAVTTVRNIEIVQPDLTREPFSRWNLWRSLASMGNASLAGLIAMKVCGHDLRKVLAEQRIPATPGAAKRVLYLKTNMWFGVKAGGSVGHIAGVVNGLLHHGYEVDFAAIEPPVGVDASAGFRGVEPSRHFGLPPEGNLYRFHNNFVRQVREWADAGRYEFIYQRLSLGNYTGVDLSRRLKLPLVIEYNGSEVWVQKNWGRPLSRPKLASMTEDACLRHAHLVVTISDVLRDELIERGVEPGRIVSYPNCIDPRMFDPARFSASDVAELRARYNLAADAQVALFLGTFGPWHGVDVLAEAIRQMAFDKAEWLRRHKLHFLLVGDGAKMAAVRQTLSDPRCAPFYTLTGLVEQAQAPRHLAAADVLLSPHVANADGSRFFGSPTKLFEYMAMSKAIVASDLDQIGEVLKNSLRVDALPSGPPRGDSSEVAVLCRPGNVDDLVRGIQFAVENKAWQPVLGANARHAALTNFTWDRHVNEILGGYRRVA